MYLLAVTKLVSDRIRIFSKQIKSTSGHVMYVCKVGALQGKIHSLTPPWMCVQCVKHYSEYFTHTNLLFIKFQGTNIIFPYRKMNHRNMFNPEMYKEWFGFEFKKLRIRTFMLNFLAELSFAFFALIYVYMLVEKKWDKSNCL